MKKQTLLAALLFVAAGLLTGTAHAGPPFVNLEGVGGVAYNPLAYPAITPDKEGSQDIAGKPRIGAWYVNLNSADIDWGTIGIAETFFKRLEVSYGYESVNLGPNLYALDSNLSALGQNVHKHNVGAKLLLLEENSFDTPYVPAVSVGTIYKTTSFHHQKLGDPKTERDGFDAYLVATKLITQLPRPVLVSAGLLSTQGQVNGILGFNDERKQTFFGNIDVLPLDNLAVGFEYKQGARFSSFKNEDYWNAHVAWLANRNLTLIVAYAGAGDRKSTSRVGLGGGAVVSAQYEF